MGCYRCAGLFNYASNTGSKKNTITTKPALIKPINGIAKGVELIKSFIIGLFTHLL